ncbi:MAG: aminotransferase class IV [Pyrinomonadaceae bacterium]|nr:aminotransferase class IV [Pyrinomonadaceae bacterium]
MHKFICFNHQILPAENAFLPANSAAALYGKGIFTTVAIYNFKPFLWEKHWQRLTANANTIEIDLQNFTEQKVKNALLEIIEKNNFRTGRARLTFFDESSPAFWQTDSKNKTGFTIQTADFRQIKNKLNLTVSPFLVNSTAPLVGVKSCNYLENIMAWESAKAKGFDEAIRLNEKGEIVAACLANVFWKKNGAIFTPHLETGCLNGTTREYVSENLAVEETKAQLEEIIEADEIFLTSAGIGVVRAAIEKSELS